MTEGWEVKIDAHGHGHEEEVAEAVAKLMGVLQKAVQGKPV